jgi:transcriptional regulator with XRE-family HTH domain
LQQPRVKDNAFGKLLKLQRKKLGLTPDQLAKRMGTTRAQVYALENGHRTCSPKTAKAYAEVLRLWGDEGYIFRYMATVRNRKRYAAPFDLTGDVAQAMLRMAFDKYKGLVAAEQEEHDE